MLLEKLRLCVERAGPLVFPSCLKVADLQPSQQLNLGFEVFEAFLRSYFGQDEVSSLYEP